MSESAERPLFGAAMIVLGMAVIGVIDNFVRVAAEEIGLWQFHALRAAIAAPLLALAALAIGARLRPVRWSGALIRTVFCVAAMLLYYAALPMAPIAVVGAGLYTSPLWVLLLSVLLFRMKVGRRQVFASAIGFIGVLILLRPWQAGLDLSAVIPAAAGLFWAATLISTRRLAAADSPFSLVLLQFIGFFLAGAAALLVLEIAPASETMSAAAPFLFAGWVWPISGAVWAVIGFHAVFAVIGVLLITRGYQSADATKTALFDYSFLIFAGLAGWALWGEAPSGAAAWAGMALIVSAGLFLTLGGRATAGEERR